MQSICKCLAHVKVFLSFLVYTHSEILTSLNFNKNKILSPGLENNNTLKCCFGKFLHGTYNELDTKSHSAVCVLSMESLIPTLILLVSSLLVYHYSTPSLPAPASAIASTVFTGAGR